MYGDRRDPYSALGRLRSKRFDDAGDSDQLLSAVAGDMADALRVPYVAIEASSRRDGRSRWAVRPSWLTDDRVVERPLVDRGERIGRLLVGQRAPTEPFSRSDQRLLDDLARRVGAGARELTPAPGPPALPGNGWC